MALGSTFLFAFPACTLAWALLVLNSYAKNVALMNGRVELRSVTAAEVADAAASAAADASTALDFNVVARLSSFAAGKQEDVWGTARSRRTFIMSYNDDGHARRILKSLKAKGAYIVSYIPDRNIMVSARKDVAFQVAFQEGAQLAECGSKFKIAEEWWPLFAASSSSSSSSGNVIPLGRKRALALANLLSNLQVLPSTNSAQLLYGILVELQPGIAREALTVAEVDWPSQLAAAVTNQHDANGRSRSRSRSNSSSDLPIDSCRPAVMVSKDTVAIVLRVLVYLCQEHLAAGLDWLSQRQEVKWITPLLQAVSGNTLASILMQTGDVMELEYATSFGKGDAATYQPYWQAGLMGQGEIIGMGDTGLNVESCYFSDPLYPGMYSSKLGNEDSLPTIQGMPYCRIPGHRKVVQYTIMKFNMQSGDARDAPGHGTAVAGSMAGARLADSGGDEGFYNLSGCTVDSATGAAPKAKISFIDLSSETRPDAITSILVVPEDLATSYFGVNQAAGAFIHSSSWGTPSISDQSYLQHSEAADRFLWENPGAILIQSAGNDGARVFGRSSITEPSLAKNVVAVGAGTRQAPGMVGYQLAMFQITVLWKNGRTDETMFFPIENSRLSTYLRTRLPENKTRVVLADPPAACKSLKRLRLSSKGAVVLVTPPSQCSTYDQVKNVMNAGGIAMIILRNTSVTPSDPVDPSNNKIFDYIPVSFTYPEWSDYFLSIFESESMADVSITKIAVPYDSNLIPSFSSSGLALGGRIKPDIIAPGLNIVTAGKSSSLAALNTPGSVSDSCRVDTQSGTSFAAPLVAGHMAIMRQYFRSGFYPNGKPMDNKSAPFTPSGMLLKALTIAGAKSLEGGIALMKGRLGPPPDAYQGWGRMSLSGSLPLPNVTHPDFRLQVADWGSFTATGQKMTLEGLNATGTGPVIIVLVYYDFPSNQNTGGTLVNNLDLSVALLPDNKTILGNQPLNATKPKFDNVNTVERVLLAAPAPGTAIRIIVNATNLGSLTVDQTTPQRFAVAVLGYFKGVLRSPLNPAWISQQGLAPQQPGTPPTLPRTPPLQPDAPMPPPSPKRVIRRRPPSPLGSS